MSLLGCEGCNDGESDTSLFFRIPWFFGVVGAAGWRFDLGSDGDLSLTFETSAPMFPSEKLPENSPVFLFLDGPGILEGNWGESPGDVTF